MNSDSWDPLVSTEDVGSEIINAAKKREIKNILKSYVGMYDSFSELIQNAMDAVDKRSIELKETAYLKKIYITIRLKDNTLIVTDNGIGFNEKEFRSFLAPNISFKDGGITRGNKGVGATFLAYGFNYLQLGTKRNGFEHVGHIEKGREWVEDIRGIITRPVVVKCDPVDQNFVDIDRGSTFVIKFGGDYTRPKNLSWFAATTPEQWLYLLLIKTPLGCVYFSGDKKEDIRFDLAIVDKDGNVIKKEDVLAEFIFPHDKIVASINLSDVISLQKKLLGAGKDPSNIPGKYFMSNGIHEYFKTSDLVDMKKGDDEVIDLIKQYDTEAYGYFTYSTSVWDQFNDSIAKLRKGYRVLRGGLQIANNRMIQGDTITIPLTSNIGYQNQCFVIVHFRGADPDLGRKGFQPELKDAAEKIAVSIVNRFKKWKKLLKADTGARPAIEKEIDLQNWIKDQEEHEKKYPLQIRNKNFFAPLNEISITSFPQSEQDVVVLFNQLIAGGVIRSIKLLATSQVMQYDGVYRFEVREPFENHIFDKNTNPLGVDSMTYPEKKEIVSIPKVLEYKYSLDALMQDFSNEEKKENEISLVVIWEIGNEWKKHYSMVSLLNMDNIHQRYFHGISHILVSQYSKIYIICLKEIIEYLNDFDASQIQQEKLYSDEI